MDDSTPRFSTGVRFLDMQSGGGIPAGDVVALTAPSDSQSEVLFSELASAEPLVYASTICEDKAELRERVESGVSASDVTVAHLEPEAFLNDPGDHVDDIPSETCLVIDPMDPLETGSRARYLTALNELKQRLRAVDSVAFLHCLADGASPEYRSLTLKRVDHVWRLRQSFEGDELATTLFIPKSRTGETVRDAIKIELSDHVQIDTSRNIA